MTYVDGFVVPLKKGKEDAYFTLAKDAGKIWMEHGALQYKECIAEDMTDNGFCATFPNAFQTNDDEVVVFAFIVFESREHRDEVNKKVMADPRLKCDNFDMPFDCARMAYGGFKTMVDY